jgi:CHU_C Type IX secretion signal domain
MKTAISALLIALIFLNGCKNTAADDTGIVTPINCDGLITDTLGTNDNARIFMPTAFTSNGDGRNDIIKPTTRNVSSISFTLYDSQNSILFNTTQLGVGWVAPSIATNTYSSFYYKIQVTTNSNRKIGICGIVHNLTCYPSAIPRVSLYFEDQLTANGFTLPTSEVLTVCQ